MRLGLDWHELVDVGGHPAVGTKAGGTLQIASSLQVGEAPSYRLSGASGELSDCGHGGPAHALPVCVFGYRQVHQDIDPTESLVLENDVFDERKGQTSTLYSDGITLHTLPEA